jgi:hypothetical protein
MKAVKSIYGSICLTWFLYSRGLLPHIISVLLYSNIFIPVMELINKWYELIENVIVITGRTIIKCEAIIFECFNYINPIYNIIKQVESIFTNVNIDTGPPNIHHIHSIIRTRKTSTGKHLCSYYARKRRRRRKYVISGSKPSKNDNSTPTTNNNGNIESPPSSHYTGMYSNVFYPIDDPSCEDA